MLVSGSGDAGGVYFFSSSSSSFFPFTSSGNVSAGGTEAYVSESMRGPKFAIAVTVHGWKISIANREVHAIWVTWMEG
jgi:hypothetical protein